MYILRVHCVMRGDSMLAKRWFIVTYSVPRYRMNIKHKTTRLLYIVYLYVCMYVCTYLYIYMCVCELIEAVLRCYFNYSLLI